MSRHLPPLNALRAFEATSRLGSVRSAALELSVTPGAVTRQIRKLEDWLGQPLFERSYRQITPTPPGYSYAALIGKALDDIDAATRDVAHPAKTTTLRICGYASLIQRWVIPRWSRYYKAHPNVDIRFVTTMDPIAELDKFDGALCLIPGQLRHRVCIPLYPIVVTPVCSPSLLPLTISDLHRTTLLHCASRPMDWLRWTEHAGLDNVHTSAGPVFPDFNLAIQAAVEGLGILLVDEPLAAREIQSGQLVIPFGPKRTTQNSYGLVFPAKHSHADHLTAFAQAISAL